MSTQDEVPRVSGQSLPKEPKLTETDSKFGTNSSQSDSKPKKKFDLSQIKAKTGHGAMATVEQMVYHVSRPSKNDFFYVNKDTSLRIAVNLIEDKENNENYLVMPDVASQLPGDYVVKILVMVITRGGSVVLWPIKAPSDEGKLDSWNESAMNIVDEHAGKWIRLRPNMSLKAYDCVIAKGEIASPEWPDISYDEVIEKAFKGKIIDDLDHPMLKNLRGEL
ncbi:MAG: hypothetical protein HQL32_01660 [Planctomycetes bacterium]|nr:hypothetical protein [Planctomycetota bacterium]